MQEPTQPSRARPRITLPTSGNLELMWDGETGALTVIATPRSIVSVDRRGPIAYATDLVAVYGIPGQGVTPEGRSGISVRRGTNLVDVQRGSCSMTFNDAALARDAGRLILGVVANREVTDGEDSILNNAIDDILADGQLNGSVGIPNVRCRPQTNPGRLI